MYSGSILDVGRQVTPRAPPRPLTGPSHGLHSGERHALPEPRDAPSYILHREEAGVTPRHNVARGLETNSTSAERQHAAEMRRMEVVSARINGSAGRVLQSVVNPAAYKMAAQQEVAASLDQQRMVQATRAAHDERTVAHLDNVVVAHADAQERNVQARAWTRKELEHQTAAEQRAAIASKQAGRLAARAHELAQERALVQEGNSFMDRFGQSLN